MLSRLIVMSLIREICIDFEERGVETDAIREFAHRCNNIIIRKVETTSEADLMERQLSNEIRGMLAVVRQDETDDE